MRRDVIPEIVRAAGVAAVLAYCEFLDDARLSAATRKLYRVRAGHFLRWAASRGLSLDTIDAASLAAYAADIATATKSKHVATVYLTPVRGVLGHMAKLGVLAADPCPKGQPNGRTTASTVAGKAPSVSLAELKRIVLKAGEADGWEEGDEDVQAGLVLLAPLSIGSMDPAAVATFTGVREPLVREFADRLTANGIWQPDSTVVLGGDNDLAFMMDVWVARGMLERKKEPADDAASASGDTLGVPTHG